MADFVFILGAGASKESGAPLMHEFLEYARKLMRSGRLSEDDLPSFNLAFDAIGALQSVHSKTRLDLTNIESVFTTFEMAKIIDWLPDLPNRDSFNPVSVSDALLTVITATLEHSIQYLAAQSAAKLSSPQAIADFAQILKSIHESRSVAVITFNYDYALEFALASANLRVRYHVNDSEDWSGIPLLKLHGSLNWGRRPAPHNEICPYYLHSYLKNYMAPGLPNQKTTTLHLSRQLDLVTGTIGARPKPVIVPPSWNKSEYHTGLARVWQQAARELSDARDIVVIGYSMPDTDGFFRHLYGLGTASPTMLESFTVHDPNLTVEGRIKAILGQQAEARFKYHTGTLADANRAIRYKFLED